MKVCVTGASGFIGQHLVRHLVSLGHEVYCWQHAKPGPIWRDALVVFHLATTRDEDRGFYNADLLRRVDLQFPEALILNVSTLLAERPLTMHALSKQAAELYADMRYNVGRSIRTVRLSNVYGPGQQPPAVIPQLIQQILAGQLMTVSRNQWRDFLYVEDAVRALAAAAFTEKALPRMDIVSGELAAVEGLPLRIAQLAGVSSIRVEACVVNEHNPSPYDSYGIRVQCGWQPRVFLTEGLTRTIEWWRTQ